MVCAIKSFLEFAVGLSAIGAAIFWFIASWIARGSVLNTPMAEIDEVQRSQARFNAIAAFCAGISALCQSIV